MLLLISIATLTFNILRVNPEPSGQPATEWSKTFGGTGEDWAESVQQTSDGGYILGGGTTSIGAGSYDNWLIKVDSAGNVQWSKTYGDIAEDEGIRCVRQTSDGGYIFIGSFATIVDGVVTSKKRWLVKTDSLGNQQWNRTDVGVEVGLTSDGGYIIAGSKGVTSMDFWLLKTDGNGNTQWEKTYGGPLDEYAWSVQQTSDGGYIVAGDLGIYEDVLLLKTDSDGNMLWNKTYGGASYDHAESVQQTTDGGYIFAGFTGLTNVWIVKTDSSGNQLWARTFGSGAARCIRQTKEAGYIIAGVGNGDFYLIKTDSAGNQEWSKTFGGTEPEDACSVEQTTDGGYVIAGYTDSFGAGNRDAWVIKLAGEAPPAEIWVPDNYTRIDWAIGNASDGDTIRVRAGTYYEHLTIDKSIKLIGEDRTNTIIDGNKTGTFVIKITANNVVLSGFTIQNSNFAPTPAIRLDSSNNVISNNTIMNNGWGIYAFSVSGNIISNNIITDNVYGVYLEWSDDHIVKDNTIANHQQASIYLRESRNNIFRNNIIENNKHGIVLISYSNYNKIYHNNFINNISPGFAVNSDNNVWDDGYPSGGNYWSDYMGADLKHGSGQNLTGSDGIGDTPHFPGSLGTDNYPLMGLSGSYEAGTWDDATYDVQTVSNSTVSDFIFNVDEKLISFNVTGLTPTTGFCRVAIPDALLGGPYNVLVGTTSITPSIVSNGTHSFLYFTYNHSSQNVKIIGTTVISEFLTLMITLLFMVSTLIATIVFRRKYSAQNDVTNN
ncbi:hypothetical protein G4O51_12830 [Candidatus Bathyarchaeota archaeon A05DMB-2]|nr:hypothetical protein [Candidatus Bathyarchaeota archaeon A05DMB-2]